MATGPYLRHRATAIAAIVALFVSGLNPLVQAVAASQGTGTLLAAICSPYGVRFIEIDLGVVDRDTPPAPPADALDHCPGCLGGGASALLSVVFTPVAPLGGKPLVAGSSDRLVAARTQTNFRPRAPPSAG